MAANEEHNNKSSTEQELVAVTKKFKVSMNVASQIISYMKIYEESGSAKGNEIDAMRQEAEELNNRWLKDPNSNLARAMRGPENYSLTAKKKMIEDLKKDLKVVRILFEQLDQLEDQLRKYNLPNRLLGHCYSFESSEDCSENLRRFMRVNWKEPAERSRERGYKCLMDLIVELSRSEDEEKRSVSEVLRMVLVHLGIEVSRLLVKYLLMDFVSTERDEVIERIGEVEAVIGCLSIEENNGIGSAVIGGFVSVVRLLGRAIEDRWIFTRDVKIKDAPRVEREGKVFRLIVMEILRLEVSFQSPDLGFMLENQVFRCMGIHLLDNVFDDKLNSIREKIKFLKVEFVSIPDCESIRCFYQEFLDLGVREAWNKLRLNNAN